MSLFVAIFTSCSSPLIKNWEIFIFRRNAAHAGIEDEGIEEKDNVNDGDDIMMWCDDDNQR